MQEYQFTHFHVGLGRVTAAVKLADDNEQLTVGLSFSSPRDQFCKKKGRMIAAGRAVGLGKHFYFYMYASENLQQRLELFLATCKEVPNWARGQQALYTREYNAAQDTFRDLFNNLVDATANSSVMSR